MRPIQVSGGECSIRCALESSCNIGNIEHLAHAISKTQEEAMRIGVPKEIKVHEYRVGMTPAAVREATAHGHEIIVQRGSAERMGLEDAAYRAAGARIADTAEEIFATSDIIVKVKEPQREEIPLLRAGQTLFTYLHLAAEPDLARALAQSGITAIAYETVTAAGGGLPLLAPMSEVAGRMAVQAGAHCLEMEQGGRGVLLGGVAGVPSANVAVLGGGVAGINAVRMAIGLEARVTVLDIDRTRLYAIDQQFGAAVDTVFATRAAIEEHVIAADLVIAAVLVPGAAAPTLITREMVAAMPRGSVIVDISIDQGGCAETSRPTTHADPTYVVDGVVHYCVTNMPGAIARTSTFALNNATLPFVLALADKGPVQALRDDEHLRSGLNLYGGHVAHARVAEAIGLPYREAQSLLT